MPEIQILTWIKLQIISDHRLLKAAHRKKYWHCEYQSLLLGFMALFSRIPGLWDNSLKNLGCNEISLAI